MIRLNSPKLNYLMITGVIIVYIGCIIFVIPTLNPGVIPILCTVCILSGCVYSYTYEIYTDFHCFRFVSGYSL